MPHAAPRTEYLDKPDLLKEGLYCARHPSWAGRVEDRIQSVLMMNLRQELWPYGDVGMDWADEGYARLTLAVNVLDRFLPRRHGEAADFRGVNVPCNLDVELLHEAFAAELLPGIPFWGGILPRLAITDWLGGRALRVLKGGLRPRNGG